MKKKILKITCIFLLMAVITFVIFLLCFFQEIRTIKSLKTYDVKDLYSLNYYADYGFDEFIKVGAKNWDECVEYMKKKIAKGLAERIDVLGTNCSSFVVYNEKGEVLFARNFDYTYSPVVMTTTNPENGYAMIGACDMGFLRFAKEGEIKAHRLNLTNATVLYCPYFTTDGMNEYGLAMSVLDCGYAKISTIEDAPTLTTCSMIRMVLENAKNVDEAIKLFKSYNISLEKPNHHFMIADATGRSVVMEYTEDGIVAFESSVVTNFDLYDSRHRGVGQDRYNIIENTLKEKNGILSEEEALDLLARVVVPGKAQYSTLYNLTTGEVHVFTHGDNSKVETFELKMIGGE